MRSCILSAVALTTAAQLPPDWAARGPNLVGSTDLQKVAPGYYPVVGNGWLAREMHNSYQWYFNGWPWKDSGSIHVAGFNNGLSWVGPSRRAALPSLSVDVEADGSASYNIVGAAIDYGYATFFNRTTVQSSTCTNTVIEKRTYAHRGMRHLLVTDLTALAADPGQPWTGCTLYVNWNTSSFTPDVNWTVSSGPCPNGAACMLWAGSNVIAEETNLPLTSVAMAWDSWVAQLQPSPSKGAITFTAVNQTKSLRVVIRADIDDDIPSGSTPAAEAAGEWNAIAGMHAQDLWAEHLQAWDSLWARGGVELAGNSTLATIVNASLYDILSSLRNDWLWSTGPGGLGTDGYCGHSFWDMETWMFPVLLALHPDIAWAVVQYRLTRLSSAMQRATDNGYQGAFWPWESGVTGLDTAPWRDADLHEHHISADIPLSWRRFYYATGNTTFLSQAWPALNQTCTFWACRFTRTDSVGPAIPGSSCSPKDGSGNWTINNVICPDEGSGIANASAYTNAAAAETLNFCLTAAQILGETTPAIWADMASSPYLPLVSGPGYSPDGPVHQEYASYNPNKTINQADVALLQYPLGLDFGQDQNKRDLDFWATKTNFAGMFTGDAAYSAAYLALGDRSDADAQIDLIWAHVEPHFMVFKETADDSGTQHFITGNGGVLQSFVFGYPGLRIERLGVFAFTSQKPLLPPSGVTAVKLRGLNLFNAEFDLWYDDVTVCAQLSAAGGAQPAGVQLELRTPGGGNPLPLTLADPACVPVQAVEVAVMGMP